MTERYARQEIYDYSLIENVIPFPKIYPSEEQEKRSSYSSIDDSGDLELTKLPSNYQTEKSLKAIRIKRTFYTKKINDSLLWLSKNHKKPLDSTPYIQPLLENLKEYKDIFFEDPYSSFLSALYDALVANDSWIKLRREHFSKLINIINPLNNNPKLSYDKIDKAINEIDKLGLDSTPF